jgi:hypothetical protein
MVGTQNAVQGYFDFPGIKCHLFQSGTIRRIIKIDIGDRVFKIIGDNLCSLFTGKEGKKGNSHSCKQQ